MKLSELEPQFYRIGGSEDRMEMVPAWSLEDAQGVMFLCPACFVKNGGSVGTHSVHLWFNGRGVSDEATQPGRWNPSGTGIDDLTFVGPGLTSVRLHGGCNAHFFVENGEIRMT